MKKQLFAGVAIALTLASCKKPTPIYNDVLNKDKITLEDQLKEFAPQPQTSTANSEKAIELTTDAGNKIKFPSNAFVDQNGKSVQGNVQISVTEITNISDMIFSGIMTNSDQGPLSSQGEFNIQVTQNGNPLQLADSTTFTIENPNSTIDTAMVGWNYVPADTIDVEGTLTIIEGFWSQNEFEENNECARLQRLADNVLYYNFNSDVNGYWERIEKFKRYGLAKAEEEQDLTGKKIVLVAEETWNSNSLACNNINNGWIYMSNNNQSLGSGPQLVNSFPTTFSQDLTVTIKGCEIKIDGVSTITFDPNLISIQFNQLSWCNIDQLISKYGGLYNCELKLNGIPKTAYVKCLFPKLNGATNCEFLKDDVFIADRLPSGMEIDFLIYFKDGDKIKYGVQTIKAAQEMEFDISNLQALENIDELAEEIKKLTE